MSYLQGIFVKREADRRALRDKKRDAFFADYSAPRLTDPFALDVDPVAQQADVMSLIKKSFALHDENTSGLAMMQLEMTQLAFGLPTLPIGMPNQLKLHDIMPEGMEKSNFSMGWAGWFDG